MEGAEERAVRVAGNLQGLGVGAWVLGCLRGWERRIHGHPPLVEFSSFLIKLKYHVDLSCLHLH